jgi:hypothetical protein
VAKLQLAPLSALPKLSALMHWVLQAQGRVLPAAAAAVSTGASRRRAAGGSGAAAAGGPREPAAVRRPCIGSASTRERRAPLVACSSRTLGGSVRAAEWRSASSSSSALRAATSPANSSASARSAARSCSHAVPTVSKPKGCARFVSAWAANEAGSGDPWPAGF